MKLLNKLVDFSDTEVSMVILLENVDQFEVLAGTLIQIGKDRCVCEVYKDAITAYMVVIRLPYIRYLAMMRKLTDAGWTLKPESSNVDIFSRMIKRKGA